MMEGDIKKKGMLYQQQQRFGKKWKKVWAEAVGESMQSVSCLELFEFSKSSMKDNKKRTEGKKVIVMRDCVKIRELVADGCPKECSAFMLETAEKTHMFASPSSELQSWITELCRLAFPMKQADCRSQKQDYQPVEMQENTLYGTTESVRDFLVIAVSTEAAVRCNLYGEYILTPQSDTLLLREHKTKKVLLKWPYRLVRKFGQDTLSFNFEAGRRCESGEGYFEFATSHSEQLFTIISDALRQIPKDASGTRPKELQTNPDPQKSHTPPPQQKHPKKKLTTSYSLNTINVGDNPSKDTKVKNVNSNPPLSGNVQDPVYALITKAKPTSKNTKNKQLGPLPDCDALCEEISGVLEDDIEDQGTHNRSESPIHGIFADNEPVYSEVKNYDGYGAMNEALDTVEYEQLGLPSDFLKGIPCMDEDEELGMSMNQLAIHCAPDDYRAENMYSGVMDYYDDYGDTQETVDSVDNQEYFYPPSASETHFRNGSNLTEQEGFCTYDNLPKRL